MSPPVTVAELLGNPITLGMIVSVVTEVIKFFPDFLSPVVKGNKWGIRLFVAVIAVGLNVLAAKMNGYAIGEASILWNTFASYLTALGMYDFVIRDAKKKE